MRQIAACKVCQPPISYVTSSSGDSRAKHYVFSGRVRTRDAGSERVDWQFVGFPSASASAASVANEPSFTLESASRPVQSLSSVKGAAT